MKITVNPLPHSLPTLLLNYFSHFIPLPLRFIRVFHLKLFTTHFCFSLSPLTSAHFFFYLLNDKTMFFRNSFCSLLFCEIGNWQRANSDRDPCLRSGHQWHWWSCHHLLWWSWFQFCHIAATIAIQLRTHVSCGNLWQMIELQLPPQTHSNTLFTHTHRHTHRHWHTITLKSKTFGGGGKIPVGWRWKTLELRYYFHIGLWTMTVVVKTTQ